jgi:hypothetical protein
VSISDDRDRAKDYRIDKDIRMSVGNSMGSLAGVLFMNKNNDRYSNIYMYIYVISYRVGNSMGSLAGVLSMNKINDRFVTIFLYI